MKHTFKILALLLLTPMTAWAGGIIAVPEPGVLPLLGIGIAVAVAVRFFRKKK